MEAVLTRPEHDIPSRKARIIRWPVASPSDAELEARFANLKTAQETGSDSEWQDNIEAISGKKFKPIEKWL